MRRLAWQRIGCESGRIETFLWVSGAKGFWFDRSRGAYVDWRDSGFRPRGLFRDPKED